MPYYWRARHKYRSQFAKKIHTLTDKCKYSVFTKPSYKWFIFVTKILLASSGTTFAHRWTSSSNTYWLIQAKSRLNVHTATFLVQASKLKTHKLTHSGEEPFICIQCNFSCTQADNLKRHTGEKTHKCAQCDYSFIHCQMLENHMRTHTGDVWSMCSFLCSVSRSESTQAQTHKRETFQLWPMWSYLCSSWHSESTHARNPTNMSSVTIPVLTHASRLKRHRLKHTGEKPFKCDQCNYSCTQAGDLKIHKRKYTGEKPFNCDQCDYSCTRPECLKVHKRNHTGEKPFKCDQCSYSCKQSGHLQRHTRKMHKATENL